MNEQIIFPFSDEFMEYNYHTHKYILTPKCVLDSLGISLETQLNTAGNANPSMMANMYLIQISNEVYNYLYEYVQNTQYWTFVYAKAPSLRDKFKQMMLDQVMYSITNGFLSNYSGVNIAKGTVIDGKVLRGAMRMANSVTIIANQVVAEIGVAMTYSGSFNLLNNGQWPEGDY